MALSRNRNAERCPGETVCTDGGRIWQERRTAQAELPVLTICEGDGERPPCPLLWSKEGQATPDLLHCAAQAYRLHRLAENGATFAYPDALTPMEWAIVDAFAIARIDTDNKDAEARNADAEANAAIQRLEAAKRRR